MKHSANNWLFCFLVFLGVAFGFFLFRFTNNNNVFTSLKKPRLKAVQKTFSPKEPAVFILNIEESSLFPKNQLSKIVPYVLASSPNSYFDEKNQTEIIAYIKTPFAKTVYDKNIDISPLGKNNYQITVNPSQEFKPGQYELVAEVNQNAKKITLNSSFSWGVLTINFDRSVYKPHQSAFLQIASLDENGHTLCHSNLTLTISDPRQKTTKLTTGNGINLSGFCSENNVTDIPDYFVNYQADYPGNYLLTLKNEDTGNFANSFFTVENNPQIIVSRQAATRINPFVSKYTMEIEVTSTKSTTVDIKENIPKDFIVTPQSGFSSVVDDGGKQYIIWANQGLIENLPLKLTYEYQAPKKTPEIFFLGPLFVGSWQEKRQWQLASDAPSLVVDGTSSTSDARGHQRRVIRTTYGANGNRVFVLAYTGSTLALYYSDDAEASSPTWNSASIFNLPSGDMVWDQTNDVIYIAYGIGGQSDSSAADIRYRRVTNLGTTPTIGTERVVLDGIVGGANYGSPGIEIAGDSGTTKVLLFGNKGTAGGAAAGFSVAAGTINSDNPSWTTYDVKSWTASATSGFSGVSRMNTDKLVVEYTDGNDIFATRHDDSSSATASSGWDALDGTDNSQTTVSLDSSGSSGQGSVVGMPASDAVWFSWLDGSVDVNTRRWNGTGLDTEMVPLAFAAANVGESLTSDGVTLWLVSRNDSDATQLVYQSRSATDGTTAWSGTKYVLDDLTENINTPLAAKKIYQGKLDVVYTTATNNYVKHMSSYKLSGNVYQESASSPYEGTTNWTSCDGSTTNIAVSVNGGTKINAQCSSSDGSYYFVLPQPTSSDQDITVFLDTGAGDKAALFTHNNDTITDITGLTLYKNRVIIRSESSSSITNADINTYDQTNDSDIPIASDGTNSTVDSGFELHINSGDSFAPGGNVTASKLHLKGTYTGASETLTLNGSGSSSSCDDTSTNLRPLCIDSGTYTGSSNTTDFTGTTASLIQNATYNNLGIKPGANSITHTLMAGTTTISGNLTIGDGTHTSVTVTAAPNSTTLTVSGNLTVAANTTFVANASNTMSVAGNWTTTGSFTHSSGTVDFNKSSSTQTVNSGGSSFGSVTHSGAGTLQLSTNGLTVAGTFSQTGGTFDANSLNQTFQGAFSLSSGTTYTKGGTLTFAGSGTSNLTDNTASLQDLGAVTVDGSSKTISAQTNFKLTTLTIGADDTLNISSKTLTIQGTGTPLVINSGGTFTTTGSTVVYTGTTTATNITTTPYNNLTLTPSAATTYSLTGHLTGSNAIVGNLTINNNATLDAVNGSNYNISLAGNWANSGSFTPRNNTVTLAGADSSTQALTGNTTFYNLSVSTSGNSAGRTVQFAGSSTNVVTGTWTVTGYSGKVITLQSSNTNAWTINPTAASVTYVSVSRSTNTGVSFCATYSTDGNNNTGWNISSGATCGGTSNMHINGIKFNGIKIN